ncbi:MAG: CRTAC1 family protein [Myxococcales bacterium]|nr:CRTAC1 family protein [Myxococcales bacterium]
MIAALLLACGSGVELSEGGEVTCEAPELRLGQPFDQRTAFQESMKTAELHGGGAVAEDFDRDGRLDLFMPGERIHQMRWGVVPAEREDPLFLEDRTAFDGMELDFAVGATAVDYDGDGDLDVLVIRWERPHALLRNDGDRRFTEVGATAFPDAPSLKSQSASWGDIDGDGDLDLFVGSYGDATTIDVLEDSANCSDHIPDPAELWRNEGDGTFTDVSDRLPAEVHDGYSFMSGFYDIDGDGFPELFSAHDDALCAPSVMLANEGGTFSVVRGNGFDAGTHDMGMGVGDLNGDELPDFLLTSWNGSSFLQSSVGGDGTLRWVDQAQSLGLSAAGAPRDRPAQAEPGDQVYGWGAELVDVDNDGDLDALQVFGFWSYYEGAGDPFRQRDGLWIQEGGSFTDQAVRLGMAHEGMARGLLVADLNHDGYVDVLRRVLDGPTPLSVSRCGEAGWVSVRLRAPGPNTHGVGAKVRVITGDRTQVRWIGSGSSGMYTGAPLVAHVGVGETDRVDRIEVVWPDGERSVVRNVAARQEIVLTRVE